MPSSCTSGRKRELVYSQGANLRSAKRHQSSPTSSESDNDAHLQDTQRRDSVVSLSLTSSYHTAPLIPLYPRQQAHRSAIRSTGVKMIIYSWPPGRKAPQKYTQEYFRLLKQPIRRSWDPTLTNVQLFARRRIMNPGKFNKRKRKFGPWIGPPMPYS